MFDRLIALLEAKQPGSASASIPPRDGLTWSQRFAGPSRGKVRNVDGIEDLDELNYIEHGFFELNLETALAYLHAVKGPIACVRGPGLS